MSKPENSQRTKPARCPICGKAVEDMSNDRTIRHAPFCSSRCKDRDLARWFGGAYSVPGRAASPDEIERALRDGDN